MPTACQCCECQGKKCLVPHPGHSHRVKEIAADFLDRVKAASTPTQRMHNLVDSLGRCDRCEAETHDDPVVLCQNCAQPTHSADRERAAFYWAFQRGLDAVDKYGEQHEQPEEAYAAWRASQPQEPTWQPIETAPKDGTSVLVAGRHNYVGQARFVDRDWYEANNDPGDAWGGPLMPPSHWMPLPPAPTDPREGGEK
jgi:hypothetical protein